MPDHLYLSAWLENRGMLAVEDAYRKLLEAFPYSKLSQRDAVFRLRAIDDREPLLAELPLKSPPAVEAVMQAIHDFQGADRCFELEAAWDLWVYETDWRLGPARVLITGYGPEFEQEGDEQIRVDFGLDDQFLPDPANAAGLAMIRANIQSLLHLAHDVDERLKPARRQLWSESGLPFTGKLEAALTAGGE